MKISLPAESVPNQCSSDGGWLEILKLTAPKISSENGEINGIKTPKLKTKSKKTIASLDFFWETNFWKILFNLFLNSWI